MFHDKEAINIFF